jgi:hypothetical protein
MAHSVASSSSTRRPASQQAAAATATATITAPTRMRQPDTAEEDVVTRVQHSQQQAVCTDAACLVVEEEGREEELSTSIVTPATNGGSDSDYDSHDELSTSIADLINCWDGDDGGGDDDDDDDDDDDGGGGGGSSGAPLGASPGGDKAGIQPAFRAHRALPHGWLQPEPQEVAVCAGDDVILDPHGMLPSGPQLLGQPAAATAAATAVGTRCCEPVDRLAADGLRHMKAHRGGALSVVAPPLPCAEAGTRHCAEATLSADTNSAGTHGQSLDESGVPESAVVARMAEAAHVMAEAVEQWFGRETQYQARIAQLEEQLGQARLREEQASSLLTDAARTIRRLRQRIMSSRDVTAQLKE